VTAKNHSFTEISRLTDLNEGCRGHQSDKRNPLESLNILTDWERTPDTYKNDQTLGLNRTWALRKFR
jgi:hypothetical protein